MKRLNFNPLDGALVLLGATLIMASTLVSLSQVFDAAFQVIGIILITTAVQSSLSRSVGGIEERIDGLTRGVETALEPQQERLAGITRVYSTNVEALDDFFSHLESSSYRSAEVMHLSPYLILTRNRREVQRVLDRGTELRLMMLDPQSPFVEFLTTGLGNEHLKDELHASVEDCRGLGTRYPNFRFRLYREPQPFNILLTKEFAMLTPRLPLHTHRGLTLRVEQGPVLSNLEDVFETYWMTAIGKTALQQALL